MKLKVTDYRAEWNPTTNAGLIETVFEDGQTARVPIEKIEEFLAVLLLLSKAPVYIDTDTKNFECGPRPVGT